MKAHKYLGRVLAEAARHDIRNCFGELLILGIDIRKMNPVNTGGLLICSKWEFEQTADLSDGLGGFGGG